MAAHLYQVFLKLGIASHAALSDALNKLKGATVAEVAGSRAVY